MSLATKILSNKFLFNPKNLRLFSQKVYQDIIYQRLDGKDSSIAVLGLNRPRARNAFNLNLLTEFEENLNFIHHDSDIRVLIIRSSSPGIFCAGADLKERVTLTQDQVSRFVSRLRLLMQTVYHFPVPVIAAVDGTALGGGLELALACDIRTASTCAKMGLVETKLAIIPGAGGSQRLPRTVSVSLAKELIYTGRILDGNEALNIGLVNHAVKQNAAGDAAFQKAVEIAQEIVPNGPIAVKTAKEAINGGIEVDLQTALAFEENCYAKVIPTRDRLEGLQAFAEKRAPVYMGE